MSTVPLVHRFADANSAAEALAQAIATRLREAMVERNVASLLVSGGRTPLALFQRLRDCDLEWNNVTLSLTDDRWVPEQDPASNGGLVRRELLQGRAAGARFIPLVVGANSAQDEAQAAWQRISLMPRPVDVVVLGMGDDGHTASLFPRSPGIDIALDPASEPRCIVMQAPVAPTCRLSLNLSALVQSRQVYLHFTGAEKWQVWERAAALPIGITLGHCQSRPQLYWAP